MRIKIEVRGVVQGVGFRPFVYRLAQKYGLKGYVLNDSRGVEIEVEGEEGNLKLFLEEMESSPPPLAKILTIKVQHLPPAFFTDFQIKESRTEEEHLILISPDIGICEDCLRELFDPGDRRYLYPFINCTNCGPRYTITWDIPYDRPNTSMAVFPMCPQCQREYNDPADRRFHAQPNACPACGPRVELLDASGRRIGGPDPILNTVELLKGGKIVAIKGLGGFHLAVDATDDGAVMRLRERKHREEKPLAVMSPGLKEISSYAELSPQEEIILTSPQRPILLLRKRYPNPISQYVAPRNGYFGVMLPYTPLHYLILRGNFLALVMTSGNISEEPIAIDNREALERLRGIADYFLVHNRDIYIPSDDSVCRVVRGKPLPIRRSRGYVPLPVFLKKEVPQILGCGGELKNTICLTKGGNAFLSQHIGDIENLRTFRFFQKTIEHLKRILEIEPEVVAYDLHPGYLSTQWALEQRGVQLVGIQHHHAHIASCLAENGVEERVIGIALDGTGYGTDGRVWGGEILIADQKGFQRAGHFQYLPMPGGEKAIKEPWRMGVSYLYRVYGEEFRNLNIEFVHRLDRGKLEIILRMLRRGVNSPLTSSCGRLFDGIASLLGLRDQVSFEGQAAMELEMQIWGKAESALREGSYPLELKEEDKVILIPYQPIIKGVVEDLSRGAERGVISLRFHNTLVELFLEICRRIRERTGIERVALSGGCFQNLYLLTRLSERLEGEGFEVYTHSQVPPNDGGISLGQVAVAATGGGRRTTGQISGGPGL